MGDEPYEVISTSGVKKKQRQKPHNSVKLKNLRNGNVVEKTFTQADKIQEADIETEDIKYLYSNRGESWFCIKDNPSDRFVLNENVLEDKLNFLKDNSIITAIFFNDEVMGIRLPIKMDLVVTEAPPNIKGNTASGGNKQVVLETGLTVTTPLFIETGDVIRVHTDTGAYVERVQQ